MTTDEFNLRATIQMEREKREVYRDMGFWRDAAECDRRIERRERELGLLLWRQALERARKRRESNG